ncbi:hypothetical protein [Frigidibacter oleivorans]|uniref:hypothetical protein n=1 Tax=Frigidibacter oleivorans TaxID=2487129 RepID=UPI000F8E37FB|nr:hypothetical protein [Frigidibacter oleivorans]
MLELISLLTLGTLADTGADTDADEVSGDEDEALIAEETGDEAGSLLDFDAEDDDAAGDALAVADPWDGDAADAAYAAEQDQWDAESEWDAADWEDDAQDAGPAEDATPATVISDYQPGLDQIEITIYAPAPDGAVDVDLQSTADGLSTEILVAGKVQAVLDGVLPDDVNANDLFIEFVG